MNGVAQAARVDIAVVGGKPYASCSSRCTYATTALEVVQSEPSRRRSTRILQEAQLAYSPASRYTRLYHTHVSRCFLASNTVASYGRHSRNHPSCRSRWAALSRPTATAYPAHNLRISAHTSINSSGYLLLCMQGQTPYFHCASYHFAWLCNLVDRKSCLCFQVYEKAKQYRECGAGGRTCSSTLAAST